MRPIERLLERLEGVKHSGDGWVARCPAHEDRHASLSLDSGEDDRALVNCFAGCTAESILAAVGLELSDLFSDNGAEFQPQRSRKAGKRAEKLPADVELERCRRALLENASALARLQELRGWSRDAIAQLGLGLDGSRVTFPVRDGAGKLVNVLRFAPNPKRRSEEPKMLALQGRPRALFPAPESVTEGEGWLFLVEGEPDVLAASSVDFASVAVPGVKGWRAEWAEGFRDRRVCVVFDCDGPGRETARRVAADLASLASDVRVIDLAPERDDGLDIGDLVREARTAEERRDLRDRLLALAEQAEHVEPPTAVSRVELLDELATFVRRYVVVSDAQAMALALWIAHTHTLDAAKATPYLSITSAEKESGKTRLLEVLELLVAKPWFTGRVSAAALPRKVDGECPTLLLDETDTAFNGEREYSETLRGILNSGYRRSGKTTCCVGQGAAITTKDFRTFCPKALAGIGKLPDTVASRSIEIRLKKRAPNEEVEDFFEEEVQAEAAPIRVQVEQFAEAHTEELKSARPPLPDGMRDRTAECWRPLFAIADLAGRDWPERAREAALALSAGEDREDGSIRVRLLADIHRGFEERGWRNVGTSDLLAYLVADEDTPWGDWRHDKPLESRSLAQLLRPFGIRPRTVDLGDGKTAKGYKREQFEEDWARYLPAYPSGPSGAGLREGLSAVAIRQEGLVLTDSSEGASRDEQRDLTDLTDNPPDMSGRRLLAPGDAGFRELVKRAYRSGQLTRAEWLDRVRLHGRALESTA